MSDQNPITRLLSSSKAIVVLAVTLATFGGVIHHDILWHDASEFLKWVLGPWLLAQGAEDAAKHFASSRVAAAAVTANSLPPVKIEEK